MVAGSTPIFDVAHVLGHKDLETTICHSHLNPKAGQAAVRTLERMLDLED